MGGSILSLALRSFNFTKDIAMLDHTGIAVPEGKFEEVVAFYIKALEPLGYKKVHEFPGQAVGLGAPEPDFWIASKGEGKNAATHTAFRAKDRASVKLFYEAAMAVGATDNGAPGIRKHYHENYYGAFILDPVGNNIEACCHHEEAE